jgi:hypothetical protein
VLRRLFTDRGTLDLIESVYDPMRGVEVPRRMRDALVKAYPPLLGRYPNVQGLLRSDNGTGAGDIAQTSREGGGARRWRQWFFSIGRITLKAVALPYEAQIAPAFAVNVGDFDGDGNEDIFLSQNFFELASGAASMLPTRDGDWTRAGFVVARDGRRQAGSGSGPEVRHSGLWRTARCGAGDFDGDGRVDLAVSQNGAETKLYQNVLGKPGLRVRLAGPPGNPDGVGATMRLVFGGRMGAAREIHGGSGYWSQDSVVQVMGCPEPPTQIWIRWPGGKTTTSPIPAGAKEITVDTHLPLKSGQNDAPANRALPRHDPSDTALICSCNSK